MVTITEQERKWILSDPGEISLSMDGRLRASNMFIESPSSLDLMLCTQKKPPSWERRLPNSSRTRETECSQQNVMNSKALHQNRKRKASWGGGFEDNQKLSKSDSAQNGVVKEQRIGCPPVSEDVYTLQIQYAAKAKVLLEGLRQPSSSLAEVGPRTNQPPKKPNINRDINLQSTSAENLAQQCGQQVRHKAKGPNFNISRENWKLKQRLTKLQASEVAENIHCREFSEKFQDCKVSNNIVDLLTPNDGRVDEGSFTQGLVDFLCAATPVNQASIGDVLSAPSSSKQSTSYQRVFLTDQGKDNLQVRAPRVDLKEADDSLLAGSNKKQNRRMMVEQGGSGGGYSFCVSEQTKIAMSSPKKELVSPRAAYVKKPYSKNCHGKASNGTCSASSTRENFPTGCRKTTKSEKGKSPSIFSALNYDAERGSASSNLGNSHGKALSSGTCSTSSIRENFSTGHTKSSQSEKTKSPLISRASTDEAGNGSSSSTWEKIRGASTDETEIRPNKEGPNDGQTGGKKGLHAQAPRLNRGANGISDECYKQNHVNVEDAPVKQDRDLLKERNARARTKRLLRLFEKIHKQFRGGHKEVDVRNIIGYLYPHYIVNGSDSIYGDVPGVKAGDTYKYRVEMDLVGLHHQFRRGIDVIPASKSTWCIPGNPKPVSVAACIVVAGGYVDNRDGGDIIIYTGEGGNNHFHDKGPSKDQMLTFGNKALRHSRMLNLCVRVIRKFDNKPPKKPFYRYDGLYEVVDMKKARSGGYRKKALAQEEDGAKLNKYKTVAFKPLVYKFLLVRKSAKEKYKDVNLWTYKAPSSAQARKDN